MEEVKEKRKDNAPLEARGREERGERQTGLRNIRELEARRRG